MRARLRRARRGSSAAAALDGLRRRRGKALALLCGHLANRERAFVELALHVIQLHAPLLSRTLCLSSHTPRLARPRAAAVRVFPRGGPPRRAPIHSHGPKEATDARYRVPHQRRHRASYLAVPAGESGPGTIVLQEWWGVDEHIRSVCDRLAAEGFFALAPDLYRGETATQPSEAEQRMMALSMDQAEKDMCGAAEFLLEQPGVEGSGVGAVGFCLGGGLAVWAAATCPQIAAAVSYYYVMPHGKPDFSGISGPVLGHFGTADEFVPLDAAESLESEMRDAGVDVSFNYYEDAGHAFFNDTNRLGTYDPVATQTSWGRTVDFLRSALAPAG